MRRDEMYSDQLFLMIAINGLVQRALTDPAQREVMLIAGIISLLRLLCVLSYT